MFVKSSHVWFRCTLHGNFTATLRQQVSKNGPGEIHANSHGFVARLSAQPRGHRKNGISHGPSPKARCSIEDRQRLPEAYRCMRYARAQGLF
jgi:hypothetical protein